MKCTIPEISWHNKDPVLSIDIQPRKSNENFFRLASGGTDSHILIWYVTDRECGIPTLECAADLTRHQKAVNVVRFSPSGEFLASGDDESAIIIWKQKTDCDLAQFPGDGEDNKEQWLMVKTLRGHLEDVYDLCWSPDEASLISGSVDNTALVWDVKKGHMLYILRDHKSFVQGVAWDPLGQYVATNSSDRMCRVFSTATRKLVSRISKAILPNSQPDAKPAHLFHDDTLKSFFRRLCFTPCGSLLIVPSGVIEEPKLINTTLIFTRNNLTKPVAYLPSNQQYSVAVRCCPQLFALMKTSIRVVEGGGEEQPPPVFALPYRVVFAIATQSSVVLYDTQHMAPFAYVANIHYTRLTDLAWSSDGRLLVVSSSDGYCSLISFANGELGEVYVPSKESSSNVENNTNKTEEVIEDASADKSKPVKGDEETETKPNSKENGSSVKNDGVKNTDENDDDFCLILEETVNNVIDSTVKSGEEVGKPLEKCLENSKNSKNGSASDQAEQKIKEKSELPVDSEKTESSSETKPADSTPAKIVSLSDSPSSSNSAAKITPIEQRKPKRAQLITLSSPKSKRKL